MDSIVGLKGEVFTLGGTVAIQIPPAGREGAIPFHVTYLYPAGPGFPAWADVVAGGVRCRINPDIIKPPYTRLADVLFVAYHQRHYFPRFQSGNMSAVSLPPAPHPEAENFVFCLTTIAGQEVVLIDTLVNAQRFQ